MVLIIRQHVNTQNYSITNAIKHTLKFEKKYHYTLF